MSEKLSHIASAIIETIDKTPELLREIKDWVAKYSPQLQAEQETVRNNPEALLSYAGIIAHLERMLRNQGVWAEVVEHYFRKYCSF